MNKLFFQGVLALSLLLLSLASSAAQTDPSPSISAAQTLYHQQFDSYRQSYTAFQQARSLWRSSPTLEAETAALAAAQKVATSRNQTLSAYTSWLRLSLLQASSTYPRANIIADKLNQQLSWYQNYQNQLASVTTVAAFDELNAQFSASITKIERDKLYAAAQVELKLAQLASFQHQLRALYDPILTRLKSLADPLINQRLDQIKQLGDQINQDLIDISQATGSLEAESFQPASFYQQINPQLSQTHSAQLQLVNLIYQLDSL